MTVDDPRVRALIKAMGGAERDYANEEKPYEWTDAAIAGIYGGNPEVDRLTSPPPVDPEVQRIIDLPD